MNRLLIGLTGLGGSGKSTVADILVREHGFVAISFADELKRIAARLWPLWDYETLWGPSECRNREWPEYGGLSARRALQLIGTNMARALDSNVWVRHALSTAKRLLETDYGYDPALGISSTASRPRYGYRGVVLPDARFPNEVAAVHTAGGVVWKCQHGTGLEGAAALHESERHIDSLEVDALVPRGPLSEVPAVVAKMLKDAEYAVKVAGIARF